MREVTRANDKARRSRVLTALWAMVWSCAWLCGVHPGAPLSVGHAQQAQGAAEPVERGDAPSATDAHKAQDEGGAALKRDLARLNLLQEHLDALQQHARLNQRLLGWSFTALGTTGAAVTGSIALACANSSDGDRCAGSPGLLIAGGLSLATGVAGVLVLTLPTDALTVADEFATLRVDSEVAIEERVDRGESMLWAQSERGRIERLTLGGTFVGLAAVGAAGAVANRFIDSGAAVQTTLSAGLTGAIGFGAFGVWMLTRRSRYERLWDRYYREASAVSARDVGQDDAPHHVAWALAPWIAGGANGETTLGGALMMAY